MTFLTILELIKKDWVQKAGLIVICTLLIISLMQKCDSMESLQYKYDQNNRAYTENTLKLEDALGNAVYEKSIFVSNIKELEILNSELYAETKKFRHDLLEIYKIVSTFKSDTVFLKDTIYVETATEDGYIYNIVWNYNKTTGSFYRELSGKSTFRLDTTINKIYSMGTKIENDKFRLGLTMYKYEDDDTGALRVGVKPTLPVPGLSFDIQGADLDFIQRREVSRFGLGPYIGAGFGTSVTGTDGVFGWQIGVGLHYDIIQF